jgi:hypothetical protein
MTTTHGLVRVIDGEGFGVGEYRRARCGAAIDALDGVLFGERLYYYLYAVAS